VKQPVDWLPQRIYYLASGLYFGAVFLRTILIYQGTPVLFLALGLLILGFILFISQPAVSRKWFHYFPFYLLFQTILVFLLFSLPEFTDFYGSLLAVLAMQVMLNLEPKIEVLWMVLCTPVMIVMMREPYGVPQAIALSLIYIAGTAFYGSYVLAMGRAQAGQLQNQSLAQELQGANNQLEAYSRQLEQLTVERERSRLARELHDSVTQTVFSMTLTIQSALLLLERDPGQVDPHLERLNQLSQSALAEIRVLIAELKPDPSAHEDLVSTLRKHLVSSRLPENLSVSLDVEGYHQLDPKEETNLFHIAEEALNNIMKHAQTSQAYVRLHLSEPLWMEIEDHGQGFDFHQAQASSGVGLSSMGERAADIGWDLQISSTPGEGTRIRVEKMPVREEQG
jgi:signal transduction histidine kinase